MGYRTNTIHQAARHVQQKSDEHAHANSDNPTLFNHAPSTINPPSTEHRRQPTRNLWHLLTQPATSIRNTEHRRQAQLLSSLLIPFIPATLIGAFARSGMAEYTLIGAFFVLLITYFLSRTKYYSLAAVLSALALAVPPLTVMLTTPGYTPELVTLRLVWLILPILLSGLVLSLRSAIIAAATVFAALLLLPALIAPLALSAIVPALGLISTVSILVVLASSIRQRAAAELQASEHRYRHFVEDTSNVLFTANQNGHFTYANPSAHKMTGYSQDELIGMHFTTLIRPDWREKVLSFYQEQIQQQKHAATLEFPIITSTGDQKWVEQTVTLVSNEQETNGFQSSVRDVTMRRQATEALEAAFAALQKTNLIKDEIVRNFSHEFRTPLTYVVGYTGILLDDSAEEKKLTPAQREHLQAIAQSAEKMTSLLDGFNTIRTVENRELRSAQADITTLLEHEVACIRSMAEQADITLSVQTPEDLPPVIVDDKAICQVVDHLLSNALKFTPQGGEVLVRAWYEPSEELVMVSVSDTGIGIEAPEHTRIFDRFYQIDGSETRQYGGLGLGLALCKEILEKHKQRIWVESQPGKGTKFIFTLPTTARP